LHGKIEQTEKSFPQGGESATPTDDA